MANELIIEVLGSGCTGCKKMHEMTVKAVAELGLSVEVGYVTDVARIVEMGVMQSPVLAVNGQPVIVGRAADVEQIKAAISKATA